MSMDTNKEQEYRQWKYNKARRSRNFLFIIAVIITLGFAVFSSSFVFDISRSFIAIFLFTATFTIVLLSIYWYLQVMPVHIVDDYIVSRGKGRKLKDKIDSLIEIEAALSIYDGSEDQESSLVDFISNRLDIFPNDSEFRTGGISFRSFDQEILKNDFKLRLFKSSLGTLKHRLLEEQRKEEETASTLSTEETEKEKSVERINVLINLATSRLKREIELLSKRANIYIAFGSSITLAAGAVLYFTVEDILSIYPVNSSVDDTLITSVDIFSMGIRLSIVIFIEVFAFYYLKLYRNLIQDIKFYQNEITNIEMKILSLYVAESDESKRLLVSELAKTERNFIVSKKQTTIDLERRKNDFDVLQSSTDSIVKILKSVKS